MQLLGRKHIHVVHVHTVVLLINNNISNQKYNY